MRPIMRCAEVAGPVHLHVARTRSWKRRRKGWDEWTVQAQAGFITIGSPGQSVQLWDMRRIALAFELRFNQSKSQWKGPKQRTVVYSHRSFIKRRRGLWWLFTAFKLVIAPAGLSVLCIMPCVDLEMQEKIIGLAHLPSLLDENTICSAWFGKSAS